VLVECYRLLRQNDFLGKNKTAYRITVSWGLRVVKCNYLCLVCAAGSSIGEFDSVVGGSGATAFRRYGE
jgi:hypothetical protein